MLGALSSPLAICPNKLRGVYSRLVRRRVLWGGRGAAWGIFSGSAAPIGAAPDQSPGVKVGREKSAGCLNALGFQHVAVPDRLMGRWAWPFSGADRRGGLAPLGVARTSGHPVVRSGSEIWKILRPIPGLNQFLGYARAPNQNSAANGSGCRDRAWKIAIKRVGDRLISIGKARFSSIFWLSGPGMECATLGGGWCSVN